MLETRESTFAGEMRNNKVIVPEISSPENVRELIRYDPEIARYNAAVIRSRINPDTLLILVREVPRAAVKIGTPDIGNLIIYRSTFETVERKDPIELDHFKVSNWEDPRAFTSSKIYVDAHGNKSERVSIGLTAVRSEDNQPIAATVRGKIVNGEFSIVQNSLSVYENDKGKNVTPISPSQFLFRREGDRHSLQVVKNGKDENGQNKLNVIKTIEFPKKPWCEWQIGTQAQMLPGRILPIHGINRVSLGIDTQTNKEAFRFDYSLGLALLSKNLDVIKVSENPLFTRESFKGILPMGEELCADKRVIYCCGYSVEGNTVKFVVNIGDLMLVEVPVEMSILGKMLDVPSPISV